MAATETKSLWLVEVVWEGETRRSWHTAQADATAHLVRLADDLAGYDSQGILGIIGKSALDDAREFLLNDDRSAWVDCTETTTSGVCPKCDAMAGWSGDYCEPCGYQFGESLDD
jgi:hypothetical protein